MEAADLLRPSFRICSASFPWHSIGQRNHRVHSDSKGGWANSTSHRKAIFNLPQLYMQYLGKERIIHRNRRHICTGKGRLKKRKSNSAICCFSKWQRKSTREENILSFSKQLVHLFFLKPFLGFLFCFCGLCVNSFAVWCAMQFIGLLPSTVGLVNGQVAKRRMRFGTVFTLFLLLFFRVVRLSTVVYQALKLTWALVPWFVTFWTIYLNMTSKTVWWKRIQFRWTASCPVCCYLQRLV